MTLAGVGTWRPASLDSRPPTRVKGSKTSEGSTARRKSPISVIRWGDFEVPWWWVRVMLAL
ncbi:hypothetical protein E2C01_068639 [Portunus trituberculatus]|uniref:Uncharacterized protein n=1 Tax=Portunus trituberculatus TaxID=210409 RepID=A0A5B7HSI2_PORTR|nr:hypothetical protein [Portunus trituberculatus]